MADIAVPADHPLADRQEISLSELPDDRWITSVPGTVCHDFLLFLVRSAGKEPDIVCMADEYPTQLALVAGGHGHALIPRLGAGDAARGRAGDPRSCPGRPGASTRCGGPTPPAARPSAPPSTLCERSARQLETTLRLA